MRHGAGLPNPLFQIDSVDELHDQAVSAIQLPGVVGSDHMRMFELRSRLHLAVESLYGLGAAR